jgi:glycosyltransferase involved in cell wall biosynthesis
VRLRDGGVVRAVLDLCTLLSAAGHEVTLLCSGEPEVPAEWSSDGGAAPRVEKLEDPGLGGLLSRRALARASELLSGVDCAHLHGMWELSNHQLASLCRRIDRPYIYSPHGMLDDWSMSLRPLKKRVVLALGARRSLEGAACVHFAAQGEMEQSSSRFRGRSMVVPLVFDLAPFTSLPGPDLAREKWPELKTERPVLVFLSRVVANKGPDILIDAAAELRDHHPLVVIAGGGDDRYVAELRQRANAAAVEAIFTGHVDGALKLSLLQNATVFVLPTIHENFGFATLEALACGVPAVTTPGNLLRNELQASGGVLIAERTARSVRDALAKCLSTPRRQCARSSASRDWMFRRFQPSEVVAAYNRLYGVETPVGAPGTHPAGRDGR